MEKEAAYTLSCYLRASKEDVPALLGVMTGEPGDSGREHRQAVRLSTEWKRCSLTFKPEQRYVFVFVGPDLQREERVDVDVDAIQLERGEQPTEFQPHQPVELASSHQTLGGLSRMISAPPCGFASVIAAPRLAG